MDDQAKIVEPKYGSDYVKPVYKTVQEMPIAQNAPQEPEQKAEEQESSSIENIDILSNPLLREVTIRKMGDYFGLNGGELKENAKYLNIILDWAIENAEQKNESEFLYSIKKLDERLSQMSGKRYKVLYRYITLDNQKKSIEKEMKVWEK